MLQVVQRIKGTGVVVENTLNGPGLGGEVTFQKKRG